MNQLKAKMITPIHTKILPRSKSILYYGWAITDKSEVVYINTFLP